MSYALYNLGDLPRLFSFPFKLSLVGWMSNHTLGKSHAHVLPENYVCLSFNGKKYAPYLKDDHIQLAFLPKDTFVDGTSPLQDEVFFSYKPEATEALCKLFGSDQKIVLYGFPFNDYINTVLANIRSKLDCYKELGVADELDTLAIHLFSAILKALKDDNEKKQGPNMSIFELAEKLKTGADLNSLIRKYGFSRRTFYYEWNRMFNLSPVNFRLNEQLSAAADLLTGTDLPIKEISERIGFSSLVYFYKKFKTKYGKSPAAFRTEKIGLQTIQSI